MVCCLAYSKALSYNATDAFAFRKCICGIFFYRMQQFHCLPVYHIPLRLLPPRKIIVSIHSLFMKSIYLFLSFYCISIVCFSQKNDFPKKSLRFNIGESTHGTGDLKGISFGTAYTHYLKKKVSMEYHFKGTIHDGQDDYFFTRNGTTYRSNIRENTAGFQIGSLFRYSLIRTKQHEFITAAGVIGRYQSSSLGDNGYSVLYPAIFGLNNDPRIFFVFDNSFPQRLYTIGYMAELSYNYTFNNNWLLGVNAAFQNDNNGDAITHLGFMIGKRF